MFDFFHTDILYYFERGELLDPVLRNHFSTVTKFALPKGGPLSTGFWLQNYLLEEMI